MRTILASMLVVALLTGVALADRTEWIEMPINSRHGGFVFTGEFNRGAEATIEISNAATTGTAYALKLGNSSTSGTGVYGEVTATTGTTYGVNGVTNSPTGVGVRGEGACTTGAATTIGVEGKTAAPYGTGVYGHVSATDGCAAGVFGAASVDSSFGVRGSNIATTGNAVGVQGETINGSGVVGLATGTNGGAGVYGLSSATNGITPAVLAQTNGLGQAIHAAGPITCTAQWIQPLPIISAFGSATKTLDKQSGSWVGNSDGSGDEWFVDFQSLPGYIDGAVVHYDSVYLVYSTDAAGDKFDLDLGCSSGACDWTLLSEVDGIGDGGSGCDSVLVLADEDVALNSLVAAIDPVGTPDTGDICVYRLVAWYKRDSLPPL